MYWLLELEHPAKGMRFSVLNVFSSLLKEASPPSLKLISPVIRSNLHFQFNRGYELQLDKQVVVTSLPVLPKLWFLFYVPLT